MSRKQRTYPPKGCIKGVNHEHYLEARYDVLLRHPGASLAQAGMAVKEHNKLYKKDGTPKKPKRPTVWMENYVKPAVAQVKAEQNGKLHKGQFGQILKELSPQYQQAKANALIPAGRPRVQAQPIIDNKPPLVGGAVPKLRKARKK